MNVSNYFNFSRSSASQSIVDSLTKSSLEFISKNFDSLVFGTGFAATTGAAQSIQKDRIKTGKIFLVLALASLVVGMVRNPQLLMSRYALEVLGIGIRGLSSIVTGQQRFINEFSVSIVYFTLSVFNIYRRGIYRMRRKGYLGSFFFIYL